jgi:hypothetical protein
MKTPDEIKKGLKCRIRSYGNSCNHQCDTCDLRIPDYTVFERYDDALVLIQQLERDKEWAGETSDMLREENKRLEERAHKLDLLNLGLLVEKAQLEAERDAAVTFLPRKCYLCKHVGNKMGDAPCPSFSEYITLEECPNWQWRGVQKEE